MDEDTRIRIIELTADVVAAYVSNNPIPVGELASVIGQVHAVLTDTASNVAPEQLKQLLHPAVPIKKSVQPDYIVSLEDGRKFKSLKRHLAASYGMSADDYREKWGLPADYPMVAPNYSTARSALAKSMGLGRKPGTRLPTKRKNKKAE